MPRRDDIASVLIIGSGPIVIGQAAEFDYSGTQACHALRDEGYRVILVNSNPATIMTDPEVADATGVELLGASIPSIRKAEDRKLFSQAMRRIGLKIPPSRTVRSLAEAEELAAEIGFPLIIRPSFTLGGKGGATATDHRELRRAVIDGLDASPVGSALVEKSVAGWKEFELEVMRDLADNVVVICSIENVDPMGVHTGDSITVAPAQT